MQVKMMWFKIIDQGLQFKSMIRVFYFNSLVEQQSYVKLFSPMSYNKLILLTVFKWNKSS